MKKGLEIVLALAVTFLLFYFPFKHFVNKEEANEIRIKTNGEYVFGEIIDVGRRGK